MDLLSEYLSSWVNYYESTRNDSGAVIDDSETSNNTTLADCAVFTLLETLSVLGLAGNMAFLYVIFRHKHNRKPSYVLLSSLAFADIIHCLVMAAYFYPPIVTKTNPFERLASRIIMSVEWAAWGVTLSHMLALSTDRFIAVCCCYRYPKMVTFNRSLIFVITIWLIGMILTIGVLIKGHCCLIIPAPGYYTFTFEKAPKGTLNIYQKIFVPCESLTFTAVGIVTPLTLMKYCLLRRRLKRDRSGGSALSRASNHASRVSLSKRESRVLLQIAVVTLIFFLYMINYYLFYYIIGLTSKWETMFNSLLYCFNSMVHPFIYFGFNRLLRKQLFESFPAWCQCASDATIDGQHHQRHVGSTTIHNRTRTQTWSQRFFARLSAWKVSADGNKVAGPSSRKGRNPENDRAKRVHSNRIVGSFEMAPIADCTDL